MDGIVALAVLGAADAAFGGRVIAAVKPAVGPLPAETPVAALKTQLAGCKVPKEIHFVDELPRKPLGKAR